MQSNLSSSRRRHHTKRRRSARAKYATPGLLISPLQQQPKSLADLARDYYCQTWRKADPQSYLVYLLTIELAPKWPRKHGWLLSGFALGALAKGATKVFDDNRGL